MDDGTVLPHYLSVSSASSEHSDVLFSSVAIEIGEVVQIIYPDDDMSISKKVIEYIVMVQHRNGSGVMVAVPYRCVLAAGFGGLADYISYTLRPASTQNKSDDSEDQTDNAVTDGCQVLIACLNGEINKAVIISGAPFSDAPDDPKKDDDNGGHFYRFNFNGVNVNIDKEGATTFTVTGPTKLDGTLDDDKKDDNQKGCFVKFAKDGSIKISNNRDDTGESIELSTADKKITVLASEVQITTDKKFTIKASDKIDIGTSDAVNIHSDKNLVLNGGDKTYIGTDSASENLVLGQQLVSALGAFVDIWVNNQANIGIGNLGAPVLLFPSVMAQLQAWKTQWCQNVGPQAAAILSDDKFCE